MDRRVLKFIIVIIGLVFLSNCVSNTGNPSKQNQKIKGFIIDAPRGVETMEYYFRLIDFLDKEDINTIIFRLTDDQGSAYKFKSHPELKMSDGALSTKELKQLVNHASEKGIEMIPEIESFGHAKYITETDKYKFLDDAPEGADFNALCPVNDSTFILMKDLYSEVAPIFQSNYFHIGCDEVNWGHSEKSKNALKDKSRSEIWAEYVNRLNKYVKELGKETMIWADVPIYHEKDVLDMLNKDIVLIDWNYWEMNTDTVANIANSILSKGFKLIGCPAVSWCRWGPRVGASQFENIKAYSNVYSQSENSNNLGIILSNWVPTKFLQDSQWDTYYIATHLISDNNVSNYQDLLPAFLKQHFDVDYNKDWREIYTILYEDIPEVTGGCSFVDSLMFIPWNNSENIKEIIKKKKPMVNNFQKAAKLLTLYRERVKKNRDDLDALLLTVEFIDYNFNRYNKLVDFVKKQQFSNTSVKRFFGEVAKKDQVMLSKMDSAWETGRRSNNPGGISEEYLWSFGKATAYSEHLSNNPDDFIRLTREVDQK